MTTNVRRPSSAQLGKFHWYVIKVHTGREEAVKDALERRVRLEALEEAVGRILIPVEKVVEVRNGCRSVRSRKLFSGYLLCELVLDDRVLSLCREIPGVSDFVRSGANPVPLRPFEVERLVTVQEGRVNVIQPAFDPGDHVRILRGSFAPMEGEVVQVLANTGRVRIRVGILGRPVFIELEAAEILQLAGRK